MSTWQDFLHDRVWTHTWMLYIPYAARYFDFPDILSLHGAKPTLVKYDEEDPLYTLQGQRDADGRLKETFAKMGAPERYRGSFYPGTHKFDAPMQREAFAFFRNFILKRGFLDGSVGLTISRMNARYVSMKFSKLRDLCSRST